MRKIIRALLIMLRSDDTYARVWLTSETYWSETPQ